MALIYYADDEKEIRDIVTVFLRSDGNDVEAFPTGDLLLAAFLRAPCDLVLLDIMMPGMDGFEAARRIRALEAAARAEPCRVLMLSCLDDAEHQISSQYEAGADGYLAKPVDLATLRRALANLDLPANLLDPGE